MVGSLNSTVLQISDFYNATRNALAVSLNKLASGKNISQPKDSIGDYMRLQRINQDQRGYSRIQNNLASVNAMMNVAEDSGEQIVNSVKRMKELVDIYWSNPNDANAKAVAKIEFDSIKANINSIVSATWFEGKQLITDTGASSVTSAMLDPNDFTKTLNIKYGAGDVIDTTGMDITGGNTTSANAMATVDAQLDKSLSYLAKTSGYKHAITSHLNIIESITQNSNAYASTINNVDDGREMEKVVNNNIRQQASISMMAQANSARQGILRLIQ